ncbi:glycosyltransferase family 4 protein [Candidatus Saccharibacteria bacterium]|nr:glycosyltransferase family 4 protein [Candidatus Saccharibacteria bacterium]
MKIALVCPFNMLDRPGGIPQVVIHLYEGLKKKGHTVKVITQRPNSYKGPVPEDYILFGVTMKFRGGLGTEGSLGLPSNSDEIAAVLAEEEFDVINFHEPWLPMLAFQMVKHSKAAHVGSFHANLIDTAAGSSWTGPIFMPYGRPLIRKMHVITATSPASAAMLHKRVNMKSSIERSIFKTLTYIPCGVELRVFKPVKKRRPLSGPGTKTIVYLGRVEKRKGVDWLIKAFAQLHTTMPTAHLIIAGSGLWETKLRNYVRNNNLKNIRFLGYVSEEKKRELLGNAELACFPSTYGEGFGIVLLEAMAMGTPLLAGNNLGYINVMTGPGRIGLIDPEATADFANRLAVFLSDETQRKIMSAWALKEIKRYDYPKIIEQYEAVYRQAIAIVSNGGGHQHGKKGNGRPRTIINRLFSR